MARPIGTTRLRRRLTLAFLLVGAVSAGALALGSYLLVRDARLDDSADRAVQQTVSALQLAAVTGSEERLVDGLSRRPGICAVVVPDSGESSRTCLAPRLAQVPAAVIALAAAGDVGYDRIELAGRHYVVGGGRPPGGELALYVFSDETQVWDDLDQLRTVLLAGWLVMTALSALFGAMLARRTLAPVGRAGEAARSLAEGLLDTRLPVEGRDEFAVWAASFNEMADALEAKIAELEAARERERRFTADVAHELRTPLTALVGEAELLLAAAPSMAEEPRELAELLSRDVARLRRLIDDLLEISRLDAGMEPVRPEPVDAAAVVHAVIDARGWRDRVAVDAPPLRLVADPRRLERVVANLIGNALEHGRPPVVVAVRPGRVEVTDAGPGIPAEQLPHLFERFSKGDPARGGGTGLGLAIALENAQLLGGSIDVEPAGDGTRFVLRLPVTEPLHAGDPSVASAPQDERDDDPERSGQ